ncbi:MAG: malectin domain-containing carbohydrate-binding protein, partial [Planctomycetaceae bacterium]
VFGTFLNYSAKHDVLLQAGSAYRDRAKDEVSRGMVAYRGRDGRVLWKDRDIRYGGPCLLWRDRIITNGSGGFQLELLTGKKTGWSYGRMYGCNTAVGGQHLLTFRSGAAGFCDLAGDSGTGNIGGFRSSCTSNLIAADGVLSAPDFTRTCSCAYQNQTSLALIHMPDNEFWTFNKRSLAGVTESTRIGLNLGAPGDRRSTEGTLWMDLPSVGGPSPDLSVTIEPKDVAWFHRHSSAIHTGPLKWVAASGGKGVRKLSVKLRDAGTRTYTVRLYFAEPDALKPGERVFAVSLQGKTVVGRFDIVNFSGGRNHSVVREFRDVSAAGTLEIALQPKRGSKFPPLLCGVELIRDDR